MRLEGKKPGRVYSLYSKLPVATKDRRAHEQVGTLRPSDADGNENVQKTKGLISKTTTLHVYHAFLHISFLFLHDFDVTMPNFAF